MSVIDGDRLMEDGGKACGDISHRSCPKEEFTTAGKGHVSEGKLNYVLHGCTRSDFDGSHREPGSVEEKMWQVGFSVSEEKSEEGEPETGNVVVDEEEKRLDVYGYPEEEVPETDDGYFIEKKLVVEGDGHMVGEVEKSDAGKVDIDEEELVFDEYGYIVFKGVVDKSYREPREPCSLSGNILERGTRMSGGGGSC